MKFILKFDSATELAKFIQDTGIEIELPGTKIHLAGASTVLEPMPVTHTAVPCFVPPVTEKDVVFKPIHDANETVPLYPKQPPTSAKTLKPKTCACGTEFTPAHNRTMSCDACRSKKVMKLHPPKDRVENPA